MDRLKKNQSLYDYIVNIDFDCKKPRQPAIYSLVEIRAMNAASRPFCSIATDWFQRGLENQFDIKIIDALPGLETGHEYARFIISALLAPKTMLEHNGQSVQIRSAEIPFNLPSWADRFTRERHRGAHGLSEWWKFSDRVSDQRLTIHPFSFQEKWFFPQRFGPRAMCALVEVTAIK